MINSDHLSPITSKAELIGHTERQSIFMSPATIRTFDL
jgi:hypothetical protein